MPDCLNCHSTLIEGQRYCPQCGQKTILHRLNMHEIFHDAVHHITHGDKGFFVLLKNLLLHTGNVAREYVQGKRKKHFPPVNFFFIVAAAYVFIMTLNAKPQMQADVLKEHPELNYIPNIEQRHKVMDIYERAGKARIFMSKHANTIFMLATPLITLIFFLFYKKSGFNYVEHLVANMYMSSFTLLVQVIIFVPLISIFHLKEFNFLLIIFLIFQAIYFSVFYYHFIGRTSTQAKVKTALVSLAIIAFWSILSGSLIRMYISNGIWGLLS